LKALTRVSSCGVASAEPPKQLRRLGVLSTLDEHDPDWWSMAFNLSWRIHSDDGMRGLKQGRECGYRAELDAKTLGAN